MIKKFKLNTTLRDYPMGSLITLRVDNNNVPLDRYWRNRFLDAKTDNCMELAKKSKKEKKEEKESIHKC